MWYRTAQKLKFFKESPEIRFNNALTKYLKDIESFPDLEINIINKYKELIEDLRDKKLPSGVKSRLVLFGKETPEQLQKAFYTKISQSTINDLIKNINTKILAIQDPTSNIPVNIGPGGDRNFIDIQIRRDLAEKLNKTDKGSLSKNLVYLYDVNDLIGRNKNIKLIADSSVVMKPIFNENNLQELSALLKDSNFENLNNYLKKYKLKIYINNDQKYIGSL
jgi:hypothetical protein